MDSQIASQLSQLQQSTAEQRQLRQAAVASASTFDPECEHWGNVIKSKMQGLSPEGRRALKTDLLRGPYRRKPPNQ